MTFASRALTIIAGAGAGGFAIVRGPSLLGAIAWTIAVAIACHGYGIIVERLARVRVSTPLTIAAGLALLLGVSAVLARSGVLGRSVQLGLLGAGLAAGALRRLDGVKRRPPRVLVAFSVMAAVLMVVIAIVHEITPIDGGANHVFAVKRMWDTGSFGVLRQQLGFAVVGEGYASWSAGAQIAAVFELAWCPALLIGILAYELPARDRAIGAIAFIVVALPLAIFPDISTDWSGALVACGAFFTLDAALVAGRRSWHTVLFAVALGAARNEYLVVGTVYIVAGLALPRISSLSRRVIVACCAGWVGVLIGFQVAVNIAFPTAVVHAVELLLVAPLVAFVCWLLGQRWNTALAVHWFATLSLAFGLVNGAVRETQHVPSATVAVWVALAICTLTVVTHPPAGRPLGGIAAFVLTIVMGPRAFDPAFNGERWAIAMRHAKAVHWVQDQVELDCMMWVHEDVRAMQELVPPGGKLLFWGRSAALLDFTRNPIRDVSWTDAKRWRAIDFLTRLTPAHLAGGRYLIVEELQPLAPQTDPWGTGYVPATSSVQGKLVELGRAGLARAYKIE